MKTTGWSSEEAFLWRVYHEFTCPVVRCFPKIAPFAANVVPLFPWKISLALGILRRELKQRSFLRVKRYPS